MGDFDPRNPRIEKASGDAPTVVYGILEANSQSFKAGELVLLSSNTVSIATTGDAPIFGIALKAGSNVTTGNIEIPVALIDPGDNLLMMVQDGSAAYEAANTTCVPGTAYDIVVSSNVWHVDSSDTTNPCLVFLQEIRKADGDASYWGRFRPLAAELYLTAAG